MKLTTILEGDIYVNPQRIMAVVQGSRYNSCRIYAENMPLMKVMGSPEEVARKLGLEKDS